MRVAISIKPLFDSSIFIRPRVEIFQYNLLNRADRACYLLAQVRASQARFQFRKV